MFDFKVTPDGQDEYRVKSSARDIVQWERGGKNRSLASLQQDIHMEDLYAIAHLASKRNRLFNGSLNDFIDSCDLEVIDPDEETQDPFSEATQQAA